MLWGVAFVAGPGFALGVDSAVTPAATQVGAIPGIPILGIVPESTTTWLLLLVLLPVGVGAMTGGILRSQMSGRGGREPLAPRATVAVAVAVLTGGVGALIAVFSSGSLGPGRLAETGPQPGPLALALGLEVLVGLAILLLAPAAALPARGPRVGGTTDRAGAPGGAGAPGAATDHAGTPAVGAVGAHGRPAEAVLRSAAPAPWLADPAVDSAETRASTTDDADIQARIRDAWARVDPLPGARDDEPETGPTGDDDRRPVD